jgi:hypothetical protein
MRITHFYVNYICDRHIFMSITYANYTFLCQLHMHFSYKYGGHVTPVCTRSLPPFGKPSLCNTSVLRDKLTYLLQSWVFCRIPYQLQYTGLLCMDLGDGARCYIIHHSSSTSDVSDKKIQRIRRFRRFRRFLDVPDEFRLFKALDVLEALDAQSAIGPPSRRSLPPPPRPRDRQFVEKGRHFYW